MPGSSGQPLAELFIKFTAQGADVLDKAQDSIIAKMAAIKVGADAIGTGAYKTLAEQTVRVNKEHAALVEQMRKIDLVAKEGKFGASLIMAQEGAEKLRKKLEGIGAAASMGFNLLKDSILGFVTAGLQGTVQQEQLALAWQQLNQQIAAIFLPVVQAVLEKMQDLVRWFRSLTGEQQQTILKWTLFTAGLLLGLAIIPKVIAAFQLMVAGIRALQAAMIALQLSSAPMVLVFAAIAIAVAALVGKLSELSSALAGLNQDSAIKEQIELVEILRRKLVAEEGNSFDQIMRRALGDKPGREGNIKAITAALKEAEATLAKMQKDANRSDLAMKAGAPESFQATYDRINRAFMSASFGAKPVDQQQLEVQQKQLAEQEKTNQLLGNMKPPVV